MTFVLNQADSLVGFGLLIINHNIAYLDLAYVALEERRNGVYNELVNRRIAIAKNSNVEKIIITIMQDHQRQFFADRGFVAYDEHTFSMRL